jgi:hypothetical protein
MTAWIRQRSLRWRGLTGVLSAVDARDLGQPTVQPLAQLIRVVVLPRTARPCDHDAGRRDTGDSGQADDLPAWLHQSRRLPGGGTPDPHA